MQRRSRFSYQGIEAAECGQWQAFYCHANGTKSVLGTFRTAVEAAEAHDMAVLSHQDRLRPHAVTNQFMLAVLTAFLVVKKITSALSNSVGSC